MVRKANPKSKVLQKVRKLQSNALKVSATRKRKKRAVAVRKMRSKLIGLG